MVESELRGEGIIDATPIVVYKAFLDEFSGVTNWWMPILKFRLRGDLPITHEGAIVDVIDFPKNRMRTSKLSWKMTKLVEGKLIEYEIVGDSVGTAMWTFEPIDGKTKVRYQINARVTKLLVSLMSHFVNLEKRHSESMQDGFKALNSCLSKK
jgi:uncharacterized protein YndB with AHSA1/START domain